MRTTTTVKFTATTTSKLMGGTDSSLFRIKSDSSVCVVSESVCPSTLRIYLVGGSDVAGEKGT